MKNLSRFIIESIVDTDTDIQINTTTALWVKKHVLIESKSRNPEDEISNDEVEKIISGTFPYKLHTFKFFDNDDIIIPKDIQKEVIDNNVITIFYYGSLNECIKQLPQIINQLNPTKTTKNEYVLEVCNSDNTPYKFNSIDDYKHFLESVKKIVNNVVLYVGDKFSLIQYKFVSREANQLVKQFPGAVIMSPISNLNMSDFVEYGPTSISGDIECITIDGNQYQYPQKWYFTYMFYGTIRNLVMKKPDKEINIIFSGCNGSFELDGRSYPWMSKAKLNVTIEPDCNLKTLKITNCNITNLEELNEKYNEIIQCDSKTLKNSGSEVKINRKDCVGQTISVGDEVIYIGSNKYIYLDKITSISSQFINIGGKRVTSNYIVKVDSKYVHPREKINIGDYIITCKDWVFNIGKVIKTSMAFDILDNDMKVQKVNDRCIKIDKDEYLRLQSAGLKK